MSNFTFQFLITYFKPSGKFYTSAIVSWEIRCVSEDEDEPYYHDAIAKLRGLLSTGGQGSLPGLSGKWEGLVCIERARLKPGAKLLSECPDDYFADGVPHLLRAGVI